MNVSGNELKGDTLSVSGSADIYATNNATLDNLSVARGVLPVSDSIQADGTLNLNTIQLFSSNVNISGDTLHFIGTSRIGGNTDDVAHDVLSGKLTGNATLSLIAADHDGAALEIDGSVSHGLTVSFNSAPPLELASD